MELTSDAFHSGRQIPLKYTKDGEGISPPLSWTRLPSKTSELALIFENITPQTQAPLVHWILYKIPSYLYGLPEGFQHQAHPDQPAEALQGTNDLGNVGYDGPLGTVGRTFRFRFRLFALEEPLVAPAKLNKDELFKAMSGHILDEAELICTHERSPVE